MAIKKRPLHIASQQAITAASLETIFTHYDEQITELEARKPDGLTALDSDATNSEIIEKINEIINVLNGMR